MKIQQYKTKSSNHRINATAFYHKGFRWKVILPTKVYNYLVDMVEKKPPFKTFKLALAMYYLSLIISIPTRKKDKIYKWGYVPLSSRLLEKKYYKYTRYFDYFLDIEIIQKINYSTYTNTSNGYRFNYSAIKTEGNECLDFSIFEISDEKLNEKILDENFSNDCPHLSKWLNEGLIIDFDNLIASMEDKFCYNKYDAVYSTPNPIIANVYNYWHCALMMKNQIFRATRDDNSDNRIHTNLTNLPKSFRPFLSYEGEMIASLDIKNSQPYFMVLLLERYNDERIKGIIQSIYDSKTAVLMNDLSEIIATQEFQEEFQDVKKSIISGMFYEYLGDEVFSEIKPHRVIDENGEKIEIYRSSFYNRDTEYMEMKEFKGKRNLMKKLTLQLLYTPLKRPAKEYQIFQNHLPMLCKCIELFKTQFEDKDSYKNFPKLLQHIESDCILDFVTVKLAEKYPEMPLWTIHDSICTTVQWFPTMQNVTESLFSEYSQDMNPKFESEDWIIKDKSA
ncbi:hypothetical protein QX233_20730 [Chryseobacterium gambrini]|uniref:Uncharacterized protein n=1 Tax=Chryseobacterium gambrini TaxID=373672 RepID=A0AAJ1VPE1_9FLAO|nr:MULTISPECIES: hypothetical protein [Chryseobacterium]MDN4014899.1 hypothetical protein [Chryseobacterium gambrini]QWA39566.1 hypothetical protein KKI44_04990 [Chryseobacterium sp. ZHDP1]